MSAPQTPPFSGETPAPGVGPAVRAWLLRRYARPRAKRIARDFGVSLKVAGVWLAGGNVAMRHFSAMVERWEEDFLKAVYPAAFQRRGDAQAESALAALLGEHPPSTTAEGRQNWRDDTTGPATGPDDDGDGRRYAAALVLWRYAAPPPGFAGRLAARIVAALEVVVARIARA